MRKFYSVIFLLTITNLCVANSLLSLGTNTNAFLADLNVGTKTDHLSSHVSQLTDGYVEAWEVVNAAKPGLNYRRDWKTLEIVKSYLNTTSINTLGGVAGLKVVIEKNIAAGCEVCDPSSAPYLNFMDKYIADVKYFTNTFSNTTKKGDVLDTKGIKGAKWTVEGAAFLLRVLHEENITAQEIDAFEETYNEENKKVVDIKKKGGILVECKSWAIGSGAFTHFKTGRSNQSGSFSQFTSYLQNGISTMAGLEYWFDGRKLTGIDTEAKKTQIKNEFKNMMVQNAALTNQGIDVFNAIWGNVGLRYMFDLSATATKTPLEQFKDIVSDTNNNFYQFIKVK